MKKIFFILLTLTIISTHPKDIDELNNAMEGNFALPTSQQPGPLFSFGQTIIDKGDTLIFTYIDQLKGINQSFYDIFPGILYGITDNLSILATIPFALSYETKNKKSSGIKDIYAQIEYAFYTKEQETYANQATIVGGLTFPTGSTRKTPMLGVGSPIIFIGITANHLGIDWYYFGSFGVQIATKHKDTKAGNSFFYEFGIGKNIAYSPNKWLFTAMLEFDFISTRNSIIKGKIIGNGDIFFIGPSMIFSNQCLYIQAGIEFPIYQNFFTEKTKYDYYTAINISWKFN